MIRWRNKVCGDKVAVERKELIWVKCIELGIEQEVRKIVGPNDY